VAILYGCADAMLVLMRIFLLTSLLMLKTEPLAKNERVREGEQNCRVRAKNRIVWEYYRGTSAAAVVAVAIAAALSAAEPACLVETCTSWISRP